jgi:hypothetical protein
LHDADGKWVKGGPPPLERVKSSDSTGSSSRCANFGGDEGKAEADDDPEHLDLALSAAGEGLQLEEGGGSAESRWEAQVERLLCTLGGIEDQLVKLRPDSQLTKRFCSNLSPGTD